MFSTSSCVCAVNYQARCIREQRASTERPRFIVGSCSTRDKNELSILEYCEHSNSLDVTTIYSHPNEVWALDTSPEDTSLIITSGNGVYAHCDSVTTKNVSSVNLWKMENQTNEIILEGSEGRAAAFAGEKMDLQLVCPLEVWNDEMSLVHSIKWKNQNNMIITSDSHYVSLYQLGEGRAQATGRVSISSSSTGSTIAAKTTGRDYCVYRDCSAVLSGGCGLSWDPHAASMCAVASDRCDLMLVDGHNNRAVMVVRDIHRGSIKDVDYNPNKPNTLATAGTDGKAKFWDLRNAKQPLLTLAGHSHWVCSVKYNPFHDQLLLSGGSDNLVNLWRVSSISSVPWEGGGGGSTSSSGPLGSTAGRTSSSKSRHKTDGSIGRGRRRKGRRAGDDDDDDGDDDDDLDGATAIGARRQQQTIEGELRSDEENEDDDDEDDDEDYHQHNDEEDAEAAANGDEDRADARVRCIDQHEDSVYATAWCASEAWLYASLSFDGRIILNHVPSSEKYKILL